MPLRADHMEPAEPLDLLALSLHLVFLLKLMNQTGPFLLGNIQPGLILILQHCPSHRLGIATENDVSTTTCHVGGNSYCAWLSCFGNNFCFALVLLGVQYLVFNFL